MIAAFDADITFDSADYSFDGEPVAVETPSRAGRYEYGNAWRKPRKPTEDEESLLLLAIMHDWLEI